MDFFKSGVEILHGALVVNDDVITASSTGRHGKLFDPPRGVVLTFPHLLKLLAKRLYEVPLCTDNDTSCRIWMKCASESMRVGVCSEDSRRTPEVLVWTSYLHPLAVKLQVGF